MTKLRIFKIICNIYLFSNSCLCTVLAVSVLYFEKKIGNRLHEYSKIRDFVTYQITFLMTIMTCQQRKVKKRLENREIYSQKATEPLVNAHVAHL